MHDFDLYIFLVFTFGHFIFVPFWLKRFAGGEFSSLEEYLFYASFFAVGSFYVVLHFIGLLGGISLWKGVITLAILHFCLWQPFFKITFFQQNKDRNFGSMGLLNLTVLVLVTAIIGRWIYLAYQNATVAGIDALHYHAPHMVNFANGEPLLGLLPTPHLYPMAHNLLGGWLLHGLHSPLVIDWLNIPGFILIFASFSFLFRLLAHRSGFPWALLVVFILFSSPMLNAVENVSSDLSHTSSYLVLFTMLTSVAAKRPWNRLQWVALSLSLGLVIGTKTAGLPLTLITVMGFALLRLIGLFKFKISKPEIKCIPLYLLLFLFGGGIWLFRSWYLFGSPIAPLGFSIFGIQVFDGIDLDHFKYYLSILKDMRDIPDYHFFHHLYATVQKWYGRYYIFLFAFPGVLFLDTFLFRSHYGKTIVNLPETLRIKYGFLILYISTFMIQGRLLMGAPWSSLNFSHGSNVRFILPLVLCSFPLFFSFVIPGKSNRTGNDYAGWVAMAILLLINLYLYFAEPYNNTGFVQYPSFLWICIATGLFLLIKLLYTRVNLNKTVLTLVPVLLFSSLLYYDLQKKSSRALEQSKSSLIRDFQEYKSTGTLKDRFLTYKEVLFKIKELEVQGKISCTNKRFFLLTRFDFPLCLQGPLYNHSVADMNTPHLQKSAKKVGFRFKPDKYCEFLISAKNPAANNKNLSTQINLIRNQIADFLSADGDIVQRFHTKDYSVYQVVSGT